ncbi:hypothetical protein [Microcoleus sp.]|uniref:hypothetical protein n=1 Tax=Microcoleus sp. TaxID=44472 RepID=UPI00403ECC76
MTASNKLTAPEQQLLIGWMKRLSVSCEWECRENKQHQQLLCDRILTIILLLNVAPSHPELISPSS